MADTKILPGSRLGPWAISASALVTTALLAFGLTEDRAAPLRDAVIEARLLSGGPTQAFLEFCDAAVGGPIEGIKEELESVLSEGTPLLDPDGLDLRPLAICPFPKRSDTLRVALEMALTDTAYGYVYPKASFFLRIQNMLKRDARADDSGPAADLTDYFKDGAGKKIYGLWFQAYHNDEANRLSPTINCATHAHYFHALDEAGLSDVRLQVLTSHGDFCFAPTAEEPTLFLRFVADTAFLLRAYFSSVILSIPYYSAQEAADPAPRNWRDPSVSYDITTSLNEPGGFDFPALHARLFDLGEKPIHDVLRQLEYEYSASSSSWEIGGINLLPLDLILVSLAALLLTFGAFLAAVLKGGRAALPDVLHDVSFQTAIAALLGILAAGPTLAMTLAARRTMYEMPWLSIPLTVYAGFWAFSVAVAITFLASPRLRPVRPSTDIC